MNNPESFWVDLPHKKDSRFSFLSHFHFEQLFPAFYLHLHNEIKVEIHHWDFFLFLDF